MKRLWRGFIPLLLVLLITGCSNKPSDETIQQQVVDQLTEEYGTAIFDVINFKKVNGIPRDDNTYIAEVEYDLKFKVNLEKAAKALQPESDNIFAASMKAAKMGITFGDFKAGDIQHKKQRVPFIRTDNGWMIEQDKE